MLRVDKTTGNIFGFIGEGGYITFENIVPLTGRAILVVKGDKDVKKIEFLFGQTDVTFVLSEDDIKSIGVGEHRYYFYTISSSGTRNTIIPDPANGLVPVISIDSEE